MTTCATEGCGEPIEWKDLGKDQCHWLHANRMKYYDHYDHHAHPAGGTNTTPPEELERDVKKVTMEEMRRVWWAETSETSWNVMKPLITRYTDQAVEEATADLREQSDRALVPKWSPGDELLDDMDHLVTVVEPIVAYRVRGVDGHEWWTGWNESDLAPLERECQHLKGHTPQNFGPFVHYDFCPKCGESLTKETP
jgi:hypothetical protein